MVADALTSLLAIVALLAGKFYGLHWMDPVMGLVGAVLGLLRTTAVVLLDKQGPEELQNRVREALEQDGDARVADLHVWSIAPGLYSLVASVVAREPRSPEHYKGQLTGEWRLVHQTVEVHRCGDLHELPGGRSLDPRGRETEASAV